jgi:bacteriocin-like protein
MVDKDRKLNATKLDVLGTDKPFMDKVPEIVELTEEEMAQVSGGVDSRSPHRNTHRNRNTHRHHH